MAETPLFPLHPLPPLHEDLQKQIPKWTVRDSGPAGQVSIILRESCCVPRATLMEQQQASHLPGQPVLGGPTFNPRARGEADQVVVVVA